MDYLPIFCRLDNKPVLLVGGGEVAERKARLLLDAGAQLTVVAPELDPELAELAANGSIEWLAGEFAPAQLAGKWLVVAATDRREVNALVYQSANQARIFANVVDDPKRSSFIMPSIIDRSPLMVAISSGGKAPVLARLLREKLEALLPQHLGAVAAFAGGLRDRVKARFASMGERRQFWERLLGADRLGQALARGDKAAANQLADALFAEDAAAKGEVILDGENILSPKYPMNRLRSKVGMVFQKPVPFPMTIFENVAYGIRHHEKLSRAEMAVRVEQALRQAALWDEVKDKLGQSALGLSGGQQQRLCIARAVALRPDVLLLDEPTSALDPISTSRIEQLVEELKSDYTIAIVTHNMQQAARVSDFTAFMYLGDLIEHDRTQVIFSSPSKQQTEDYITGRFG